MIAILLRSPLVSFLPIWVQRNRSLILKEALTCQKSLLVEFTEPTLPGNDRPVAANV